jgi:hypothetical protein
LFANPFAVIVHGTFRFLGSRQGFLRAQDRSLLAWNMHGAHEVLPSAFEGAVIGIMVQTAALNRAPKALSELFSGSRAGLSTYWMSVVISSQLVNFIRQYASIVN